MSANTVAMSREQTWQSDLTTIARNGGAEVDAVRAAGLDLDEGMVLKLSGRMYHGDDCIHALALLTTSDDIFNRLNGWIF